LHRTVYFENISFGLKNHVTFITENNNLTPAFGSQLRRLFYLINFTLIYI
jgi:hypothetical protein